MSNRFVSTGCQQMTTKTTSHVLRLHECQLKWVVWSEYWSSTNVIFQNIYAFLLSWPPPFFWFFVKSLTFPDLPLTPWRFQFSTLVEWSPCILSYWILGQATSVLTMTFCEIINAISDIDSDKGWMMLQCQAYGNHSRLTTSLNDKEGLKQEKLMLDYMCAL